MKSANIRTRTLSRDILSLSCSCTHEITSSNYWIRWSYCCNLSSASDKLISNLWYIRS